jgi:hypothetical protein
MFVPHSGRIVPHARDNRSNKLNAPGQLRQFRAVQLPNSTCQPRDATRASSSENLIAFRSRFNVRQPSVARIILPPHEVILLETRHYPRHCRRPHLLGARESTECKGTTEDDDGESGEARSRKAAGVILFPQLPQ